MKTFLLCLLALIPSVALGQVQPAPGTLPNEPNWTFELDICGSEYNYIQANINYLFLQEFAPKVSQRYNELYILKEVSLPLALDLLQVEIDALDNCLPICIVGQNKQAYQDMAAMFENRYCELLARDHDWDGIAARIDQLTVDFQNRPARQDAGFCQWWGAWSSKVADARRDLIKLGQDITNDLTSAKMLLAEIESMDNFLKNHSCEPQALPIPKF